MLLLQYATPKWPSQGHEMLHNRQSVITPPPRSTCRESFFIPPGHDKLPPQQTQRNKKTYASQHNRLTYSGRIITHQVFLLSGIPTPRRSNGVRIAPLSAACLAADSANSSSEVSTLRDAPRQPAYAPKGHGAGWGESRKHLVNQHKSHTPTVALSALSPHKIWNQPLDRDKFPTTSLRPGSTEANDARLCHTVSIT